MGRRQGRSLSQIDWCWMLRSDNMSWLWSDDTMYASIGLRYQFTSHFLAVRDPTVNGLDSLGSGKTYTVIGTQLVQVIRMTLAAVLG